MNDTRILTKKLLKAANEIKDTVLIVIEVEGTNFIQENFKKQGFQSGSLDKWTKRKTEDKKGRDLTRYRTNRKGKQGDLTKFGKRNKQDRPILTGYASAGNKLRNSIKSRIKKNKVVFTSYKKYAKRHNEGLKGMPKRQFMGKSATLNRRINKEIDKQLQKIFKQ